jgi:acetyl-CoA C-acetyltransferase
MHPVEYIRPERTSVMRKLAIIGIGQTPVGEHWEKSIRELAGEAILAVMLDAGRETADGVFIGNMLSGMVAGQEHLGALIADWAGLKYSEAFKVEAACGSAAAALRVAIMAVGSGELDSAIAVGVEKMTENKGIDTTAALATAADADYETIHGLSFVSINALIMRRYMYEYGWEHAHFAPFSINAHKNAIHNPFARLRDTISEDDYRKARMISTPINLLDASPIGDGAAAVLVVPRSSLSHNKQRISIAASAAATDTLAVHDRSDPLWLSAAYNSAKRAYAQSSLGPESIDLFELHDAFSIMTALSLEACGFADRGAAPKLGLDEKIAISGKIPICTSGGLKARGHPVGATGLYQIVEIVRQLRGEVSGTQIEGAKIGMAQNIGGSGATIVTHILTRE